MFMTLMLVFIAYAMVMTVLYGRASRLWSAALDAFLARDPNVDQLKARAEKASAFARRLDVMRWREAEK